MRAFHRFRKWLANPWHLVVALASLVPPLVVLVYMVSFVQNVPLIDMYWVSFPTAAKVQQGTLTLADLFEQAYGHQFFFMRLVVALTTFLFDWPVAAEAYLAFLLSATNFAVLCILVYRQEPGALLFALVPISTLVFSLNQSFTWLLSLWSVGIFPVLFFLLGLLVLHKQPVKWRHVGLAALLALCATFSHGSGLSAWPALLVAMWVKGIRNWKLYVFWGIAAVIGAGLFFTSVGLNVTLEGGRIVLLGTDYDNALGLVNPLLVLRSILTYLSNPFVDRVNLEIGPIAGAFGIVLLAVNLFYLWQREHDLSRSADWVALAVFALGGAFLVTFGRNTVAKPEGTLRFWYMPPAILLWVGVISSMSLADWRIVKSAIRSRRETLLLGANLLLGVLFILLYAYNSVQTIQKTSLAYGFGLGLRNREAVEECYFQALFTRDASGCPPDNDLIALEFDGWDFMYGFSDDYLRVPDKVAADRLAMFSHLHPLSIMPEAFEPGDPVIVETSDLWVNIHIGDWLLGDAPPESILHIVPREGQYVSPDYYPDNLVYVEDINEAAKRHFWSMAGEGVDIWSVSIAGEVKWGTSILVSSLGQEPFDRAYRVETYRVSDYPVLGSDLVVMHYQPVSRESEVVENPIYFGDIMWLESEALQEPVDPQACQPVTVETTWEAAGAIEGDYSMTAVLVNAEDGSGVVSADEPPTGIGTPFWRPRWTYVDRRTLVIPCDIAPGDYHVLIGVYDMETVTNLPVSAYDGTLLGDWLYLTTLTIEG